MPVRKYSRQSICNPQAGPNRVNYSDTENAILKRALLIIDKSLDKLEPQTIDSEEIQCLIKKISALTNIEAILVIIRDEISSLKTQLSTTQTNLQECVQELNRARNYQQRVGEPSPLFKTTLNFFMLWLAIIMLRDHYVQDEIFPIKHGVAGACTMLISIYLLSNELIDFRINRKISEKDSLEQNKRQLTQQSQYLIDLEAKLSKLLEKVAKSGEPRNISPIGDCTQREKGFTGPTSISEYLLNYQEKSIRPIASNQENDELRYVLEGSSKIAQ